MIHLHNHSEGSADGLGQVARFVEAADKKGFPALALTEHGSLSTALLFKLTCERNRIKPILGMEGYISFDGERGHITLLASDLTGWHNLVRLNNRAQASEEKRPVFSVDDLIEFAPGLICLSGCMQSPLQRLPYREALKLGARLKGVFGDRLYAELMTVNDNRETVERTVKLATDLKLETVWTNDAHFPYAEDAPIHPVLTSMKMNGFVYDSAELWLKSETDLLLYGKKFRDLIPFELARKALDNTHRVAERITNYDLSQSTRLPAIPGIDNPAYALTMRVKTSLAGYPALYVERAKYELSIINSMGFAPYFLILLDIVETARSLGSRVGPGRGSGVGSLVLFLLGITAIDPIEYGLQFERFMNPERSEYPDVDMDFDSCSREPLLEAVAEKWGAIQIATYSSYSHKVLTNDLCKHFNVPVPLAASASEYGPDSVAFQEICERFPLFEKAYNALSGQVRHKGKHAGGVVLTTDGLLPLERVGDRLLAAWTEGQERELTHVGQVKFDLLGLSALDVLKFVEERAGRSAPFPPEKDSPVFRLFQTGKVAGIFQFSGSAGIIRLTQDVMPDKFSDLVAINALYRPGPLAAGTASRFTEWRKNPRTIHPLIDPILAETSGVIVFQEQVMAIVQTLTGGTMAQADQARKLFSKPHKEHDPIWEGKVEQLYEVFLSEAEKRVGKEIAELLWTELITHSQYSFNKSHATAYSRIAWEMAYWKYYEPALFYAAMLNHDTVHAQEYLFEAVARRIKVRPPHVNVSGHQYEARNGEIYMPFSAIKFLGDRGSEVIIRSREKNGEFESIEQFMQAIDKRSCNARVRRGMLAVGALDGLTGEVESLLIGEPLKGDSVAIEREVLGFILPDADLLDWIKQQRAQGFIAGIVESVERRDKGRGPYYVIRLAPQQTGWIRSAHEPVTAGALIRGFPGRIDGEISHIEEVQL